jgi:hypothetical protein
MYERPPTITERAAHCYERSAARRDTQRLVPVGSIRCDTANRRIGHATAHFSRWPGCVLPPLIQPDAGPSALPICAKDFVEMR